MEEWAAITFMLTSGHSVDVDELPWGYRRFRLCREMGWTPAEFDTIRVADILEFEHWHSFEQEQKSPGHPPDMAGGDSW